MKPIIIGAACLVLVLLGVFIYPSLTGASGYGFRCEVAFGQVHKNWQFSLDKEGHYTLREDGAVLRRNGPYTFVRSPQNDRNVATNFNLGTPIGTYYWAHIDFVNGSLSLASLSGSYSTRLGQCHDDSSQGL